MPPYTISIDSLNYCLQTIKELAQELAEESYNVVKQ
jgi:hypothetical protein